MNKGGTTTISSFLDNSRVFLFRGDVMLKIAQEVKINPERVLAAPLTTPVTKIDETLAARKPDMKFNQES